MTDNVEDLILEHLRVLRSEIQTMRTEMHSEFKDVKLRMSSIENAMVSIRLYRKPSTDAAMAGSLT
jgi:hypothetical protein